MALRLYEKYGFQEISDLKLDLAPWKEGEYLNKCMVRQPAT
jgi:ribosomal protein S18 acetylase RimI-like enzyme